MNNVKEKRTTNSRKTRTSDHAEKFGVGRLINDCVFEALESRTLMSVAAPTQLVATPASATSVTLRWHDNDSSAKGYNILRRRMEALFRRSASSPRRRRAAIRTARRFRVIRMTMKSRLITGV